MDANVARDAFPPAGSPGPGAPLHGDPSRPGLLRALGLGVAISIVIGNVIGSGIFLKPGVIASAAGDLRIILAGWVLGGILCLLGGLCFAELAVMLPQAGGLYVFLREAYGKPVGFLFGWAEFLFGRPASIGALSVAFGVALEGARGAPFSPPISVLISVGLIALLAAINTVGVSWGGRVQATTTVIKAGILMALAVAPFVMSFFGGGSFEAGRLATTSLTEGSFAVKFAAVMIAVMWAYDGWHDVAPVAEEVRNPQRNIPLALIGGIGFLLCLYVALNIAFHGVLTMEEIADTGKEGASQHTAQLVVSRLLSPIGENATALGVAAISLVIMCSTFGAINSNLLAGPRVSFAMGRDNAFFSVLGRVHGRFHTPAIAIVVQATMASLLVAASALLVSWAKQTNLAMKAASATDTPPSFLTNIAGTLEKTNVFDLLTNYVVFSASISYMLAVTSLLVLRYRRPDWPRAYRTPGFPLTPLLYLAFYGWFMSQIYRSNPFEANVGIGLILLGLPFYYLRRWLISRSDHRPAHSGESPPASPSA